MRNVPIRIYLPEGPVLQELAPPLLEDGVFLLDYLQSILTLVQIQVRRKLYAISYPDTFPFSSLPDLLHLRRLASTQIHMRLQLLNSPTC